MNKKILLFTLLFMLFSVSFASARMCDTDNVLDVLRKALYIYYTNPKSSSFTTAELKDLLGFYVGIQSGQITVECTAQSDNVDKANALQDQIPSCSDGTKYGKCSSTKPMYCYAGRLVPRCRLCGCPTGQSCDVTYVYTEKGNKGQWGKCYPGTKIICAVDSDCGVSDYTNNYYCTNGDVFRNYTRHICLNPGEISSSCQTELMKVLKDDCSETEYCKEGYSECQMVESACNTDSGCGTSGYAGDYFCREGSVYRNYTQYKCLSPGLINATCIKEIIPTMIDSCGVGKQCIEGQSTCQLAPQCSDGTAYNECSFTKPSYCDNGMLVDNCSSCNCNAGYTCLTNNSCAKIASEVYFSDDFESDIVDMSKWKGWLFDFGGSYSYSTTARDSYMRVTINAPGGAVSAAGGIVSTQTIPFNNFIGFETTGFYRPISSNYDWEGVLAICADNDSTSTMPFNRVYPPYYPKCNCFTFEVDESWQIMVNMLDSNAQSHTLYSTDVYYTQIPEMPYKMWIDNTYVNAWIDNKQVVTNHAHNLDLTNKNFYFYQISWGSLSGYGATISELADIKIYNIRPA